MGARFSFSVLDWSGAVVDPDVEIVSVNYARRLSTVGKMSLVTTFDYDGLFGRDTPCVLYRTPDYGGPHIEPGAMWFCRKIERNYKDKTMKIDFADQNMLLERRIVGYPAETTLSDKTFDEGTGPDYADDLMKAYVKENFGPDAVNPVGGPSDDDREIDGYLEVEADKSEGEQIEIASAWQKVFDVINRIARTTADAGTTIFWDIKLRNVSGLQFEFVTATDASGTGNITFSANDGNLEDLTTIENYEGEITVAYIGGYGSGAGKNYTREEDGNTTDTPFNWIETWKDLGEDYTAAHIANVANGIFDGARPRISVSANLIDSPFYAYGIDFFYGDFVQVDVGGRVFNCHISAVQNRYDRGSESLSIKLEGDQPLDS